MTSETEGEQSAAKTRNFSWLFTCLSRLRSTRGKPYKQINSLLLDGIVIELVATTQFGQREHTIIIAEKGESK